MLVEVEPVHLLASDTETDRGDNVEVVDYLEVELWRQVEDRATSRW